MSFKMSFKDLIESKLEEKLKTSLSAELEEATKTFKSLEDWVMAVVNAGGSVSKSGNTLRANGLGRTQSATWELKKGRGSMIESVEISEDVELEEMRGATAGRRQSRTFPLNKKSEADAFAKKHGGTVEKKGATLYVTWDVKEAKLDEGYEGSKQDFKYEIERLLGDAGHNPLKTLKGVRKKGKKFEVDLSIYFGKDAFEHIAKESGAKLLSFKKGNSVTTGIFESVDLDEASCGTKNKKEALDPVNKKALAKDFDDRKDKDIDNDGDVDSSDEYLHNRRKAVKKAIGKDKNEDKKQFMYAAKQAKEKGDKEFVFAGKTYKVEDIDIDEGSCGTMNASKIKSMAKKKKLAASYK